MGAYNTEIEEIKRQPTREQLKQLFKRMFAQRHNFKNEDGFVEMGMNNYDLLTK